MINNPVLHKELLMRARMRQPLPVKIAVALLSVSILGWLYWMAFSWIYSDTDPTAARSIWQITMCLQFLLIGLIAPSIAANAISQEREQQTWEMLLHSRLRPSEIIMGKLVARLAILAVIMALFFPVVFFSWLAAYFRQAQDGWQFVSLLQFGAAYAGLIIASVCFAIIGLYLSWRLQRTLYAIMASYTVVVGGLGIATVMLSSLWGEFTHSGYEAISNGPLMWLNPGWLLSAVMNTPDFTRGVHTGGLIVGLTAYGVITLALLWHMIARFRRFAYPS